ncbi:MAG: hypothetical protein M1837_007540 [Sclerophora amabilis]|nr:MAG: hypothetical protein M1837_007540 [Sclerophora amabilis]
MLPHSVLATALFAITLGAYSHSHSSQAAGVAARVLHLRHESEVLARKLHVDAYDTLDRLSRRQAPSASAPAPSSSSTAQSSGGLKVDPKIWDAQTNKACMHALNLLEGKPLSGSGIAVCYNLPFLDNSTGAFQADLRLYRVSPPTGAWVGVADPDIDVGLNFNGASVSSSNNNNNAKRESVGSSLDKRAGPPLKMLQSFNFIGRLNADLLNKAMNMTQLQLILSPNVTLTATNAKDEKVSTTLSSKEASFINGIMSQPLNTLTTNPAKEIPFVLPGVTLGIFPVGLIITCTWAALGIAVVSWGTIGRYKFRHHYRRRKRRGNATDFRKI